MKPEYFRELAQRLNDAPYGGQGELINTAAEFLGISRAKVYRKLQEAGWESGRKTRQDKGKSTLTRDEVILIANVLTESRRANGKRLLSVENAMDILQANGKLANKVSPATAIRQMRELCVHPEQLLKPSPHVQLRSLHPNYAWQFDVSVCVLYYLDTGGLSVMDANAFYKNKPENLKKIENKRVLRYLVTDHYSGAFVMQYIMSAGESQEALFNFLIHAFSKRDSDLMHGVPKTLIWDKGSANAAFLIQNFLDRLDVKHIAHTAHNPRAKGQVESTHNLIETQFEGRLYLLKVQNVDDLNQKAATWVRSFNSTKNHRRHGHTRYGLWQTIKPDQLRLCPPREVCELLLHTKPEQRKVRGDLTISYAIKGEKTRSYRIRHIPEVRVGDELEVCVNPYHYPDIWAITYDRETDKPIYHDCQPIEQDQAGFYMDAPVIGEEMKSAGETPTEQVKKDMAEQAYGVRSQKEVEKARAKKQTAFNGELDPISYLAEQQLPEFMPRKGTELAVETPQREVPNLSLVQALMLLRDRLGRNLQPNESKLIKSRYSDGVPEADIDGLAQELNGGTHDDKRRTA